MAYSDRDYYTYLKSLMYNTAKIAERIVPLSAPVYDNLTPQIRLEPSTYSLTRESARALRGVVTAHNLSDYMNVFYTLKLEDNEESWLHELVKNTFGQG
jgi:hypothetical protein